MKPRVFKPSVHGWPFANEFEYPGELLGLNRPPSPGFGLCGGLCWSALDRFLADRRIPRDLRPPDPGDPLHTELIQRQLNALSQGVWQRIVAWQQLPDGDRWLERRGLAAMTRAEWSRIRRKLDAGEPVLICLVREAGPLGDPSANPQVLAYRYAISRKGGQAVLHLYDPNKPADDDHRLTFSVRRGSRLNAMLSGGARVRGFFAVSYDRSPAPWIGAEPVSGGRVPVVALPIGNRPAAAAGPGGRIDLVAVDEGGGSNHFQVIPRGTWQHEELNGVLRKETALRVRGQPVIRAGWGRRMTVYARSETGELIAFRRSVFGRWSGRNLTARSGVGNGVLLAGDPVAVDRGWRRRHLFALSPQGDLIEYASDRLGRWFVENLTQGREDAHRLALVGRPVALLAVDGAVHAFGRNARGELVHFARGPDGSWRAGHPAQTRSDEDEVFRLAGDPAAIALPGGAIAVFGRNARSELVEFHWTAGTGWLMRNVSAEADGPAKRRKILSDPAIAIDAQGVVHLFSRAQDGSLLHHYRRQASRWTGDNVTSRPTIGHAYRLEGQPVAFRGGGHELFVAGRRGDALILYRWSVAADWLAESVSEERRLATEGCSIADDPIAVPAADGAWHLFATGSDGVMLHFTVIRHGSRAAANARPSVRAMRTSAAGAVPAADEALERPPHVLADAVVPSSESSIDEPAPETGPDPLASRASLLDLDTLLPDDVGEFTEPDTTPDIAESVPDAFPGLDTGIDLQNGDAAPATEVEAAAEEVAAEEAPADPVVADAATEVGDAEESSDEAAEAEEALVVTAEATEQAPSQDEGARGKQSVPSKPPRKRTSSPPAVRRHGSRVPDDLPFLPEWPD